MLSDLSGFVVSRDQPSARVTNGRSSIYRGKNGRWHGYVSMGGTYAGKAVRRHVRGRTRTCSEWMGVWLRDKDCRALLTAQLTPANLTCLTTTDRYAPGVLAHPPIDHVCASPGHDRSFTTEVHGWNNIADGVRLSDHSGTLVNFELNRSPHQHASWYQSRPARGRGREGGPQRSGSRRSEQ